MAEEDDAVKQLEDPEPTTLEKELAALEKRGKYTKYIAIVEGLLSARERVFKKRLMSEARANIEDGGMTRRRKKKKTRKMGEVQNAVQAETEVDTQASLNFRAATARQWRQLTVIANVFGTKYVDEGKFGKALEMLKKAELLADMDHGATDEDDETESFTVHSRMELKAFVLDSMAYYYSKRHKYSAALQYVQKALRLHRRLEQWEHVAKCTLHAGAILSRLKRHDEAIRCMGEVLHMVEDERLESGGASAQKICLVAVCYHNIAVEQLLLSRVHEACVSSQNARRLAKLSLSYSNRWLSRFEGTHQAALNALSMSLEVRKKLTNKSQADLFKNLTSALFS